jgi:hypothetical protein
MLLGLMYGFHFGHHYELMDSLARMLVGGWLGFLAGRLLLSISNWLVSCPLRSRTTPQLWDDLHRENRLMPNMMLRELRRRREPIIEGLPIILFMLVSDA